MYVFNQPLHYDKNVTQAQFFKQSKAFYLDWLL